MTVLPLLERELRVRARNPVGYWTRFCAALLGFLICLFAMTVFGFRATDAQKGEGAFHGLIAAAFILCCFCGFLTLDKISRERRDGTLGLLFLTRVRVLDVLLGNFGAAGISSLCALAAFAPVLLVPILSGGVTGGAAARKVLALFDTMILSLATGLWASASARGWFESARATALLLLLLILGPFVADLPGPLKALTAANDLSYRSDPTPFWISLGVTHGISWLLIVWAAIRLRLAWREGDETPARFAWPNASRKESAGFWLGPFHLKRRKLKPLGNNEPPIDWLLRRENGILAVLWAGTVLWLSLTWELDSFEAHYLARLGPSAISAVWLTGSLLKSCLFAWVASRYFAEARRTGELELLMTTPEGARTLVRSHWQWLKRIFLWPMAAIVVSWGVTLTITFTQTTFIGGRFIIFIALDTLNSVVELVALLWVGMWFGWSKKSQGRAIVWSVLLTRGCPYAFAVLANLIITSLIPSSSYSRSGVSGYMNWYILTTVIFLFYLWLIRWARRRFGTALPPKPAKSESFRAWQLIYRADN